MEEKPKFTEIEVEELQDLQGNFSYMGAIYEVLDFLKTLGYSDVNAVTIAIRKEFLSKRVRDKQDKFQEIYKDSTLLDTLCKRMTWTQKQKENGKG